MLFYMVQKRKHGLKTVYIFCVYIFYQLVSHHMFHIPFSGFFSLCDFRAFFLFVTNELFLLSNFSLSTRTATWLHLQEQCWFNRSARLLGTSFDCGQVPCRFLCILLYQRATHLPYQTRRCTCISTYAFDCSHTNHYRFSGNSSVSLQIFKRVKITINFLSLCNFLFLISLKLYYVQESDRRDYVASISGYRSQLLERWFLYR